MKTRIITAIFAIALFVPVCVFSEYIIFPISISLICAVGIFEISKCVGLHKNLILTIPMYLIALILPFIRYPWFVSSDKSFALIGLCVAFFMLIYSLTYTMFCKNKLKVSDVMSLYALFIYVVGCFSSIVMVRYSNDGIGVYIYLLIFLGAWVSDTFAYFTGRLIGKHKLIPEISPKKTVEGAIGGVLFTLVTFIVYGFVVKNNYGVNLPIYQYCILGILLPIISQIGDLIASCVKRQYNVKDFGNIFPGHGGVLDRFDSVMLVAPTLCMINAIINLCNGVYIL
ncbi:MAG: phosphatidate cytidylyltransferase [Clostridia bacterium]|nr:phosphatidate cytidylyltransferase [Clostridia bacterium]